ncbi:hypothetical protein FQN49_007126 [Arthroderma sp. PD_2]|nr:hypothetical protein FQN49_007126 [Arthroderma sp. PD_2]
MASIVAPKFICANWEPKSTGCKKGGTYTCKGCLLVIYCSPICQKSHWSRHKSECRTPLSEETWQPAWVLKNRTPSFIGTGVGEHFGTNKYLWGNIPAFDVLQLGLNEGDTYGEGLRILFAASGDLRNVIKTIAQLPNGYRQPLEIAINDRDFDIAARNIILLLIALGSEKVEESAEAIIHLWYSAFIRESDINLLQRRIRPIIEDVCRKTKDKAPEKLLGKTWTFGQHSLRVVLEKSSWDRLLAFVDVPAGLTTVRAHEIRTAITLAESRKDYRDRFMCFQSRYHRIALKKFWGDGLLLPFGYPRDGFQVPNPTFFQTVDTWPMMDNADAHTGWPSEEVANTSSGAATADIYGKLFFYIRRMLLSFFGRLSDLSVSFKLFQVDVCSLPSHLAEKTFSRIEVSNISDVFWLGIPRTLGLMMPLLQTPLENPHATLITLFMNAVEMALTDQERVQGLAARNSPAAKHLHQYLPLRGGPTSRYDPKVIKTIAGRDLVTNYDHIFDRYTKAFNFNKAAGCFGAAVKEKHTIIEKWPYRLKLRPGQPGAQEEFDRCFGRATSGKERYVEWKRIA